MLSYDFVFSLLYPPRLPVCVCVCRIASVWGVVMQMEWCHLGHVGCGQSGEKKRSEALADFFAVGCGHGSIGSTVKVSHGSHDLIDLAFLSARFLLSVQLCSVR